MSIYYIFFIMLVAGVLGGIINYFLSPVVTSTEQPPKNIWKCLIIGIGATVLVPLFLEIAQSKLLDHLRNSSEISAIVKPDASKKTTADSIKNKAVDSLKNHVVAKAPQPDTEAENPPLKSYFLFAAYCLLAASAGPRFINSLMDGVIKDKQISQLTKENTEVTKEKDKVVQVQALENARNNLLAEHDEQNAISTAAIGNTFTAVVKPQIGPKTKADDPQKGRFGGKREVNGRKLCATVESSRIPLFFKVVIWVESTDVAKPLADDVIFYLHDTFRPSVITLPPDQFTDGRAEIEPKLAWGAFTIGAVVDNGLTLLEYDLAEDSQFPSDFRSR